MLRVEQLSVALGGAEVLRDVSLEIGSGETVALLGPSGCGKTTLLRTIAGLERPDTGRIVLDGRDLGATPPHERHVGLMFQEHILFPHRDVAGNVGFGLRMSRRPKAEIAERVARLLALVGLPGTASRDVRTLSGGEQQRVALARALAPEPRVLLLDEPLGSLDGPLRDRLGDDLRSLFDRLGLTVLYVTHDVGEAFALGHRVGLMHAGRIVQTGTPDEVWARPESVWAAGFVGIRNVVEEHGRVSAIRPEAVHLTPGDGATVVSAERRGATVWLRVRLDDGRELEAVTTATEHPSPGDSVRVDVDPAGVVEL